MVSAKGCLAQVPTRLGVFFTYIYTRMRTRRHHNDFLGDREGPGSCEQASSVRGYFGKEYARAPLLAKLGSLQEYVSHDCDTSELGASCFPIRDVHRIGILDLRLFNTDRHAGAQPGPSVLLLYCIVLLYIMSASSACLPPHMARLAGVLPDPFCTASVLVSPAQVSPVPGPSVLHLSWCTVVGSTEGRGNVR